MILIIGLIISLVPSLLLYFYLRNLRKDDPEYRKNCRNLLVRGLLCCVGVFFLDLALTILWNVTGIGKDIPILKEIIRCFLIFAFAEEFVKFLNANKIIKKDYDKVSWLDYVAYIAIVAIGFQIIETFVYLIESNAVQIIVKGLTMGHPSYGLVMGYHFGKARYTGKKSDGILGFFICFFLHGLYDLSLSDEFLALNDNLVFVPFILIGFDLFFLIKYILFVRKNRNDEKYTKPFSQSSQE